MPSPLTPDALTARGRSLLQGFFEAGFKHPDDIDRFLASLPPERLGGYGGNTLCLEINTGRQQVILDGGSGIRPLGYEMLRGPCGKGQGTVHILMTHFHWDHILGLPFFSPIFVPGNTIHLYAVEPDLPQVLRTVFRKPNFPVPLDELGATLVYHQVPPREPFRLGDLTITAYRLDHPDPCWGYRFEHGGKVLSHCADTECTRMSREDLGPDLPLYQGVDLLVFDAQYSILELVEKVNWGHAAALVGLDLALHEKIKRVIFIHHEPASSDAKIAEAEAGTRDYYELQRRLAKDKNEPFHEVDWCFAREGMSVEV